MMRLLVLCLLLLLHSTAAVSEDREASGDDGIDDEDLVQYGRENPEDKNLPGTVSDKTTGEDSSSDDTTVIIIVVAVTLLALSIAAIVAVMLLRRRMQSRQQGIYSVPTEQDRKEAI